jgi:hypothetical protein
MELGDLRKSTLLSLEQAGLAPGPADGLIPATFNPTIELKVAFNRRDVTLGNLFRSSECKSTPTISFGPNVRDLNSRI